MAVIFSPPVNTGFSLFSCFFLFTLSFPARIFFFNHKKFFSHWMVKILILHGVSRWPDESPKGTQRILKGP